LPLISSFIIPWNSLPFIIPNSLQKENCFEPKIIKTPEARQLGMPFFNRGSLNSLHLDLNGTGLAVPAYTASESFADESGRSQRKAVYQLRRRFEDNG
jgi:hypothetical protein